MATENLAYMARYAFAALILLCLALLLTAAIRDFFWRIRSGRKPMEGFFLIAQSSKARPDLVKSFPLYSTTALGSARSSDIVLRGSGVGYRHAIIYIYDDRWYVAPAEGRQKLMLNGVAIREAIPLEDQDVISIGDLRLVFVNERKAAEASGLRYQQRPERRPWRGQLQLPTWLPWLCVNLFMLLGAALLYYMERDGAEVYRQHTLIICGLYALGFNLLYILLPIFMPYVDRGVILAVYQLAALGLILQLRFIVLAWFGEDLTTERIAMILGRIRMLEYMSALGLVLLPVGACIVAKTGFLELLNRVCLVLVPLMLLATRILGRGGDTHGASLWIYVGPVSIQLTEYVKLCYLLVLASFFKNRPPLKKQFLFAGWAALVFALIMLLPDLGSIMVLLPTTLVVFFVMTSEYLITLGILVGGSALSFLIYTVFPHVQRRIAGWATLWTEVNDSNRQIVYGLQSMSRGGLLGKGLGNGTPVGTPQYMDDMVFAPLCEDFGLLVGIACLLLFIFIWLRVARMCVDTRDGFSSSLLLGLGTALFFEAAVVISGATGLIPLTGATLPFIARGGSSLLAKYLLIAGILGLGARRERGRSFHEKLAA